MKQPLDLVLPKADISERNLYLCKGVTQESIEEITKNIIKINEEDEQYGRLYEFYGFPYNRLPIKIYLDTYGGFVYQCFGLLSVIERSKTPVHTIVTGCAMSCGFMILISGHERYAHKLSTPLYHQVSTGFVGKVADLKEEWIEAQRLQKMIEDIVVKKTKITRQKLKDIYDRKVDWFMNAQTAKKLGVVDKII